VSAARGWGSATHVVEILHVRRLEAVSQLVGYYALHHDVDAERVEACIEERLSSRSVAIQTRIV
jgi:hypothetical protein